MLTQLGFRLFPLSNTEYVTMHAASVHVMLDQMVDYCFLIYVSDILSLQSVSPLCSQLKGLLTLLLQNVIAMWYVIFFGYINKTDLTFSCQSHTRDFFMFLMAVLRHARTRVKVISGRWCLWGRGDTSVEFKQFWYEGKRMHHWWILILMEWPSLASLGARDACSTSLLGNYQF